MAETRDPTHRRMSEAPLAEIEQAIAGLVGVEAVRLVVRDDGAIDGVHVAMGPAWRADTLRRDVQALLLHRFDLHIDPETVHVAQRPQQPGAQAPHAPAQPAPTRRRPALDEVRVVLRADATSVDVELRGDDGPLRGSADLDRPESLFTAVVDATLAAVGGAVDQSLEPVTVDVVDVGQDQIAIATVVASDGRSNQRLTGSALVRGHVEDALARAVLDATNSLHRA